MISGRTECSFCTKNGFNPEKPLWIYLIKRDNEQEFGMTNHIEERLKYHFAQGWQEFIKEVPMMIN